MKNKEIDKMLYDWTRIQQKEYSSPFNTHEKIRLFNALRLNVYQCNWGFIIPQKNGTFWEIQTCGVMCNHVEIEGVFIPLDKPHCSNKKHKHKNNEFLWKKDDTDLLASLQQANYNDNGSKKSQELIKKLWIEIKHDMHFDFDVLEAKEPCNQEGLLWIKLKKFDSGWGHEDWVDQLIGKEIVLVYPNCD